jgi:TIR domain
MAARKVRSESEPGKPELTPAQAIRILGACVADGMNLLERSQLSSDDLAIWEGTTRRWLELALGKDTRELGSVGHAGPSAQMLRGGPAADAFQMHRLETLRAQVVRVEGAIELLRQKEALRQEDTMKSTRPAEGDRVDPSARTRALDLFISHSSRDERLAEKLALLLEAALKIRHDRVRCTSVDARELPGGSPLAATLRSEIKGCRTFVAILTATSVTSALVAAELGARWMAGGHAVILRAGGLSRANVKGLLADTSSLDSSSAADLHQLIGELANVLQLDAEPARAYSLQLAAVVAASSGVDESAPSRTV